MLTFLEGVLTAFPERHELVDKTLMKQYKNRNSAVKDLVKYNLPRLLEHILRHVKQSGGQGPKVHYPLTYGVYKVLEDYYDPSDLHVAIKNNLNNIITKSRDLRLLDVIIEDFIQFQSSLFEMAIRGHNLKFIKYAIEERGMYLSKVTICTAMKHETWTDNDIKTIFKLSDHHDQRVSFALFAYYCRRKSLAEYWLTNTHFFTLSSVERDILEYYRNNADQKCKTTAQMLLYFNDSLNYFDIAETSFVLQYTDNEEELLELIEMATEAKMKCN